MSPLKTVLAALVALAPLASLGTAATVLALAAPALAQDDHDHDEGHDHASHAGSPHDSLEGLERTLPWTDATLDMAARIAVQESGRVKPLSTYAAFTLLRLNGKRAVETPSGETLDPTAWLLDVLYFPLGAAEYRQFLVENDEVIAAMGLRLDGRKKRDRYSYVELQPGLSKLFTLAGEYAHVQEKHRTPVQQQVVVLTSNVRTFLNLVGQMSFTREPIPSGPAELAPLFGGAKTISFSEVVAHGAELGRMFHGEDAERAAARPVIEVASSLGQLATVLALVPPTVSFEEDHEWYAPGELLPRAFNGDPVPEAQLALLKGLEDLHATRRDPVAFEETMGRVLARNQALAEARGEYAKVPLEVTYYNIKLIRRSLVFFLLAFVSAAVLWLRPRNRVLYGFTAGSALVGTLLLVAAIAMRCVIRERPPVSTLYETLLFVGGVGAVTALVVEWINRRRLALSAAAVLGTICLFLANGYEVLDKQDTMPSLIAVLDTNFWLATHVTSITAGYAAGMLAAVAASFYLLGKLFGFRSGDRPFYAGLARMVYGIIAFAVILSTVGTILGGVWANDSWGRFWGWDPKENGALMIVLSQLVILHGRMGGYLREHGVCMAAAFGGTVIAFSWFGVNLLGVGLHSYGFTSGIHTALWSYYYAQWGIVGLGALAFVLDRRRVAARPARRVGQES